MVELFTFEFSLSSFLLFLLVGLLVGMSKVGIFGVSKIAVPILAIIFGGKSSSGIMLPILIMADVFGATYYRKDAQWKHLKKLLPPAIIGVLIGTYVGELIPDKTFKLVMGCIVLLSTLILLWLEFKKTPWIPQGMWFAVTVGILLGFTTMVGNLAGSVMVLYLLVNNMPKQKFIGTVAWFFILINLFKVPFHVFIWKTITWNTLWLDICLLPAVALGAFVGIRIVNKIKDTSYRYFIIVTTLIAALFMVL